MWCSSFFTPSFPTSFVGEYGNSDCPSLDAWKVLAACGFNCRSTLVMQHLEFSHSPFYRCTACQLLTTCMTLECRSWDTSSVFLLDLGSSPGRYPDPQYGDSPAGSLHMKPKAWIIKTQGSPRVTLKHGLGCYPIRWKKWAELLLGRKEDWISTSHTMGKDFSTLLYFLGTKISSILNGGRKTQKILIFSACPDQKDWGKHTLHISVEFTYGLGTTKP